MDFPFSPCTDLISLCHYQPRLLKVRKISWIFTKIFQFNSFFRTHATDSWVPRPVPASDSVRSSCCSGLSKLTAGSHRNRKHRGLEEDNSVSIKDSHTCAQTEGCGWSETGCSLWANKLAQNCVWCLDFQDWHPHLSAHLLSPPYAAVSS